MKYSSFIYQHLNQYTDSSLWQLNRYSQDFQDHRNAVVGQWDDSASAEINARHLNPHAEDDAAMRALLEKKNLTIQQLCGKLNEIEEINEQIKVHSREIHGLLIHCDDDLRKAATNFNFSVNKKNSGELKIPQTIALLNQANQNEFSPSY
jgi:hypothetical protein